ncbi:MAG TPA: hypothetical protein VLF89_02415 [Candidatus Saccharimonadales bacterium]|nr:hypothetical protein [Candidatus Saccharimonadales bacterium]
MDDSQKIQQNTTPVNDQTQQMPVASEPMQPSEKKEEITHSTHISSASKEGGPAVVLPSSESLISPSMKEVEISSEEKDAGVEVISEPLALTPEDIKAGVVHAKESTPVSTTPTATIVLPMTQQQAQQTVKIHKKVKDSLFWFAMLILRQWQVAQKRKKKELV